MNQLRNLIITDDFLNLSNQAKLLYLCLSIYKDKHNIVNCSYLIGQATNATDNDYSELKKAGLISVIGPANLIKVKVIR